MSTPAPAHQLPDLPEIAPVYPALTGRVGHLLARGHFLARDYADAVLAPFGLAIKQVIALRVLAEEGPISQARLGELLICDRTTMVQLMDGLEERGLTNRKRNPADRRAYALELSDRGREALRAAEERLHAAEEALLAPLDSDERDQLRALLLRLLVR